MHFSVQVAVSRVVCNSDGLSMTVGFQNHLSNATLATLSQEGYNPPMLASTLMPYGLTLASTTIHKDV